MKKIIVAVAAVAIAIVSNAATFDWKTATGQYVYQAGSSTDKVGGASAYLFDSSVYTQAAVMEAFAANTFTALETLSVVTTESTGAIKNTAAGATFTPSGYGAGDTLSAFFAVIDGDNIFISDATSVAGQASATSHLSFGSTVKSGSQAMATEFSQGSASFGGAGWYTAVPEPTSGLLLLLGMAGLALKRKQA